MNTATASARTRAPYTIPTEPSVAHFGTDYYGRPRFRKFLPYLATDGEILDFGCNEGVFLNFLRVEGRRGIGIDYDKQAIERCQQFGFEAQHADIFEFTRDPAHQGRYAGVMLADFVEHFDPYPMQNLLRQTVGILREGGTIMIMTPNHRSIAMLMGGFYDCTIEHHHPYSTKAIGKFLEEEGMEVVEEGADPDSRVPVVSAHPLRFARNLTRWALGRVLCGRSAMVECNYLVAKKVSDQSERFAKRTGDPDGN